MKYLIGFFLLFIAFWIAYEIKNAPMVDEDENIID